jgi:ABC-2 type transport system permease protein
MNIRSIFAIVRKDLMVVSKNKNVVTPIIIILVILFVLFPWVMGLVPTFLNGMGGKMGALEGYLTHMPAGIQQELAGYTIDQKVILIVLVYMFLPFFLMIPLMVASLFAADSFAGEKERKTLEALLYTPTTDRELFVAKIISGWLAAIAVALVGFLVYVINVNAAAWSQMHHIFFPNALWLLMAFWVVPALSGFGVSVMVVISSRAQGFQDANQLGGLVVLPVIALFYAQVAGALFINVSIMLMMGLIVWLLTGLLIWLGSRSFHRNRFLAG